MASGRHAQSRQRPDDNTSTDDDVETAIPSELADRGDTRTDAPETHDNVGQRHTGNKNAGGDHDGMLASSHRAIERPTRDDGDNDDGGALGSRMSHGERGYPRGSDYARRRAP